jgi:hypothetical protein
MPRFISRPYRDPVALADSAAPIAGDAFRLEFVLALSFVLGLSLLRLGVAFVHGLDFEGSMAALVCAATALALGLSGRATMSTSTGENKPSAPESSAC